MLRREHTNPSNNVLTWNPLSDLTRNVCLSKFWCTPKLSSMNFNTCSPYIRPYWNFVSGTFQDHPLDPLFPSQNWVFHQPISRLVSCSGCNSCSETEWAMATVTRDAWNKGLHHPAWRLLLFAKDLLHPRWLMARILPSTVFHHLTSSLCNFNSFSPVVNCSIYALLNEMVKSSAAFPNEGNVLNTILSRFQNKSSFSLPLPMLRIPGIPNLFGR